MADLVVEYLLSTGGGNITFNDGLLGDGTNKYWLTDIQGLDGPAIRAPVDLVPFGDGGIVHTFRKGPRRVIFDGMLWIESTTNQGDCQLLRNGLAFNLQDALASIISTSGTLTWTPEGEAAKSLTVYNEVGLDIRYTDNYLVSTFSFGLVSAAADPS